MKPYVATCSKISVILWLLFSNMLPHGCMKVCGGPKNLLFLKLWRVCTTFWLYFATTVLEATLF